MCSCSVQVLQTMRRAFIHNRALIFTCCAIPTYMYVFAWSPAEVLIQEWYMCSSIQTQIVVLHLLRARFLGLSGEGASPACLR